MATFLVLGTTLSPVGAAREQEAIQVDEETAARISTVIKELQSGYGGTLVTSPKNPAIDSSAFVERYLGAFKDPTELKSYDYHFERLLARVTQFPDPLEDPRLDGAIWSAYVEFEAKQPGKTSYQVGDTVYILDSARDLLWTYLGVQAPEIRKSPERRKWWMERLLAPGTEVEQLARCFAAIHLINQVKEKMVDLIVWDVPLQTEIPTGQAGLDWFADQKSIHWTLWGCDPKELAAPSVDSVPSGRWETKFAVDQESWSKKRTNFEATYYRSIGQRVRRFSVRVPTKVPTDGVFMVYAEDSLHVWPKKSFFEGVLSVLEHTGFLEPKEVAAHAKTLDLEPLKTTAQSKQ